MPRIDRLETYDFWPVRLSVRPFVCPQNYHIGHDLFVGTKHKVIFNVNVKYQSNSFRKNGRCGGTGVSQTHLVLSYFRLNNNVPLF